MSKESILKKIRDGLAAGQVEKPFPEVEDVSLKAPFSLSDDSPEEQFAAAFGALGGKFIYCADHQELMENLNLLYDAEGWRELLCAEPEWTRMFQNNKLDFIQPAHPRHESADACITGCELLVARTGSILLSSRQSLGRIAPVYWPVHIVIAYQWQLVDDIADGIALLQERTDSKLPSMINLNTGPSRTADIEKTLVVGVHGPKEVYCFFVSR